MSLTSLLALSASNFILANYFSRSRICCSPLSFSSEVILFFYCKFFSSRSRALIVFCKFIVFISFYCIKFCNEIYNYFNFSKSPSWVLVFLSKNYFSFSIFSKDFCRYSNSLWNFYFYLPSISKVSTIFLSCSTTLWLCFFNLAI